MSNFLAGIDIGSKKSAIAYLNLEDNSYLILVPVFSEIPDTTQRILFIAAQIKKSLKQHKPTHVFIEDCLYIQNFWTSKILSNLQGMIELICTDLKIPFTIVPTTRWRKICGTGKIKKEQIKKFAQEKWPDKEFITQDLCDAACLSLWGLQQMNM